jgi:hypothetical protein
MLVESEAQLAAKTNAGKDGHVSYDGKGPGGKMKRM